MLAEKTNNLEGIMACISSVVKNLASNVEKKWTEAEVALRSLTIKVFKAVSEFFSRGAQFSEGSDSSVSCRAIQIIEPSQNDLKIQTLTERIGELERELRELGESALSKDLEVHLSREAYQLQEKELNETCREMRIVKHELEKLSSQKGTSESQISELKELLKTEKVRHGQENESLLREQSELIQKLEILTEQKNGVEAQMTSLGQKLEGAKRNEAELEGQINALKADLEVAKRENAGLKEHIEAAQKTSSIAQEEMQKWEATIALAEKQKETLKEENDLLKREMDEMRRFQRLNKPVDEVSIDPSLLQSIFDEEPKPKTWASLVARHPNGIPQAAPTRQPSTPSLAIETPVKTETPIETEELPLSSSSSSPIAPEASAIVEDEELSEKAALKQKAEALHDQLDEKLEAKYGDLKRELKQIIVMMALGGEKGFDPASRLESIEKRVLQYEGKVEAKETSIEEIEAKKEEPAAEVIEEKEVSSSSNASLASAPAVKKGTNAKRREKRRALEAAAAKEKAVSKPQPKKADENVTDCSASLARIAADLEERQAFWAEQKPKAEKIDSNYFLFITKILTTTRTLSEDLSEIKGRLNQLRITTARQLKELRKVKSSTENQVISADQTFDSSDKELLVSKLDNFERKLVEFESEFTKIEGEIVQEVEAAQAKKTVATLGSRFLSKLTFGYLGTAE
ncbi:MAG TPA: hypothetical protein DCE71_08345 [Parachlamydiales bacterium]|nr:hypothetical protein [Parachlamydiales bacterium]